VTSVQNWIAGARPKTLGAALAPVLIGTSIAINQDSFMPVNAGLALVVALFLQIAVNYANDYSDGIKGVDANRVGPIRLVGSGLAPAARVKMAAIYCVLIASVSGLVLSLRTELWLVLVGLIAILASGAYTGGKNPYGYRGFGEVSVFLFFGFVATVGTGFVQTGKISWVLLFASIPVGLLAMALLVVNNLRDIETDEKANKLTLAVKIGDRKTRLLFIWIISLSISASLLLAIAAPLVSLSGLTILIAMQPMRDVAAGARKRDLIPTLQQTNKLMIIQAVLISIGFIFS
jgi:1,4-dihydroxy-2-naphthoate octaprenyltransferase